jgi:hypothetical protein
MSSGRRKKEKVKKQKENYRKLHEALSFGSLHQSELNTLVINRDTNFFMGDFLQSVSHVPTPWDSSGFVGFVALTALLYVI